MSERVLRMDNFIFKVIANESVQKLGPAWFSLLWLLVIPLFFAWIGGGEAGRFIRTQRTVGVPAFVGLLPVSTADLVRGKFLAQLAHLALMWGVLVVFAVGWAVFGGHAGDMAHRLAEVCGSPGRAWLTLLAVLFSAYLMSYLLCIGSMWGGLIGSPLTAPLPALIGLFEIGLVVVVARKWEPGYAPMLLSGLWVAFAVKLLLAEWLVYYTRKRFRVGWMGLFVAVLMWAACVAIPAGTLAGLLGEPTAALAVVVLSPLVSCLAAPAVLHRSRHGAWA